MSVQSLSRPVSRKSDEVRRQVVALAHRLGPEAKLPTLAELARDHGVAVTTMQRVLDELEGGRIIRRRQGSGIFVASHVGKRQIALVCAPSFFLSAGHSPTWDRLLALVAQRATREGERFSFHFIEADEQGARLQAQLENDIENGQVHGVIAVGLPHELTQWIEARGVPLVAVAGAARFVVTKDDAAYYGGMAAALQARGCQKIGLWQALSPGRALPQSALQAGRLAFSEALGALRLPFYHEFYADCAAQIAGAMVEMSLQEQGYALARRVLEQPTRPDGISIGDDLMTAGALTAFAEAGVVPGRDLEVATLSLAGSPMLWGRERGLILVEFDQAEFVDAIFEILGDLMNGVAPSTAPRLIAPKVRSGPDAAG